MLILHEEHCNSYNSVQLEISKSDNNGLSEQYNCDNFVLLDKSSEVRLLPEIRRSANSICLDKSIFDILLPSKCKLNSSKLLEMSIDDNLVSWSQ